MKTMVRINIILLLLAISSCCKNSPIKFDSNEWKQWEESETTSSLRWNMRKDFFRRYKVRGMSKDDIISLLGEPDNSGKNYIAYYLGYSGCGINTGRLRLNFKDNHVISYVISDG